MPHDNTATDSELLASWTIDAIGRGRLQLAEALLRLANQARRIETARLVPMAGPTRDEQPARLHVVRHDGADGSTAYEAVATMNSPSQAPPLVEAAATAIFGAIREQQLDVPESARCVAFMIDSGHETTCDHPIYWAHGRVGDLTGPAVSAGWFHVDPAMDEHHAAVRGEQRGV
jgi:hypothetical protein